MSHDLAAAKLEPCPFCGSQAQYHEGTRTHYVMCSSRKCEAMGPDARDKHGAKKPLLAIAAWNRRVKAIEFKDAAPAKRNLLLEIRNVALTAIKQGSGGHDNALQSIADLTLTGLDGDWAVFEEQGR